MITVIDYGMGNLRSVVKAVEKYTDKVEISSDPASISHSSGIIMPGDGAFGHAMENLTNRGWIAPLKEYINQKKYFMGICLGFQLLFSSSQEFGSSRGLDIIKGEVVPFQGEDLKIPHMGWNQVDLLTKSPFLKGVPDNSYFYFIHSYYPVVHDKKWNLGLVEYGSKFPCIVGNEHLIATQFHPEKSHNIGLKIIKNFVEKVDESI